MNSVETVVDFFKKNKSVLIFCAGIIFVLAVSVPNLTTKPKISTDEAVSIELARNFQTKGVLDIQTAPDMYSGFGERLQSTGYPVTIPLALFFEIFGYGFAQARIYMLLWILATLSFLYWLGRKWFGEREGLCAFFLFVTFASFYANGQTVVGEIPGFLFLLVGLYFLLERKKLFWAGFFMGFAVVSKLSVFGLLIPTLVLVYALPWRKFFQTLAPIALGMLPAGVAWIFLNISEPFLKSTWVTLFNFYQNPYSSSISDNVIRNLVAIPHSTTLIYFGAFFVCVIVARFFFDSMWKKFYDFVIVYGVLAFLYYLRSPGWLRYVLIAEFLILFLLPHALATLFASFRDKLPPVFQHPRLPVVFLVVLIAVQGVQMFTVSDIFSSDGALKAAEYVNREFPDRSVGVLNAVEVAVWLDTPNRFLAMDLTGVPQVGRNPLLRESLPEVVVSHLGQRFLVEGQGIVDSNYAISDTVGGYTIYELNR